MLTAGEQKKNNNFQTKHKVAIAKKSGKWKHITLYTIPNIVCFYGIKRDVRTKKAYTNVQQLKIHVNANHYSVLNYNASQEKENWYQNHKIKQSITVVL